MSEKQVKMVGVFTPAIETVDFEFNPLENKITCPLNRLDFVIVPGDMTYRTFCLCWEGDKNRSCRTIRLGLTTARIERER